MIPPAGISEAIYFTPPPSHEQTEHHGLCHDTFSEDIIIDPYGRPFCFVCRASLGSTDFTISQHLKDILHQGNNKQIQTKQEKSTLRQRYVNAADYQRQFKNPNDVVFSTPTCNRSDQSPSNLTAELLYHLSDVPYERAAQVPNVRKQSEFDRNAYIDEILSNLSGSEHRNQTDEDKCVSSGSSDDDSVKKDTMSNVNMQDYDSRQVSGGAIEFKPSVEPGILVDDLPEDKKSEASVLVASMLTEAAVKCQDVVFVPLPAHSFIPIKSKSGQKQNGNYMEQEQIKPSAPSNNLTLRHENGEELPPWLLNAEIVEQVLYTSKWSIALHYEILEFEQFITPTHNDVHRRERNIMMVDAIAQKLWPGCEVRVFGSYAANIYLPFSDLDICIVKTPENGSLKELRLFANSVRNMNDFAKRVEVVEKTKVPLVKLVTNTNPPISCEVSMGNNSGVENVEHIKKFISDYPALKPILLVLKTFLHQRELDVVYKGGLPSYGLLLMVVSHLQMFGHNFRKEVESCNLGIILQTFFHLYGQLFNHSLVGLQVRGQGCYFSKYDRFEFSHTEVARFCIEDPNDVTNELGRNGYMETKIRYNFNTAAAKLKTWSRDDGTVEPTPLGTILHGEQEFLRRRERVIVYLEQQGQKPLRKHLSFLAVCIDENSKDNVIRVSEPCPSGVLPKVIFGQENGQDEGISVREASLKNANFWEQNGQGGGSTVAKQAPGGLMGNAGNVGFWQHRSQNAPIAVVQPLLNGDAKNFWQQPHMQNAGSSSMHADGQKKTQGRQRKRKRRRDNHYK